MPFCMGRYMIFTPWTHICGIQCWHTEPWRKMADILQMIFSNVILVWNFSILIVTFYQSFIWGSNSQETRNHFFVVMAWHLHHTYMCHQGRWSGFIKSNGKHPHGPLARYVELQGMPGTFSPPPWVSDPDMHHGMCITHVLWCMLGLLTSGFLWSQWQGKHSRHSWRNPQFYVSGKRPM